MASKTPDRRKTLLILPQSQKRIIARASLVPAAALILLGAAVAFHCIRVVTEAANNDIDLPGLRLLLPSILGFVFAMAGLLFYQAIHFSNHIGGPAYRIMRTMAQLRCGEKQRPIKLREGDYLVEVADELNRLMEWLESNGLAEPVDAGDSEQDPEAACEVSDLNGTAVETH